MQHDVPLYKVWPGNNRFCCGGRVMIGPAEDWPYNLCAWSSLLVPSLAYFRWAVPVLHQNFGGWYYGLFSGAAFAFAVSMLLMTSTTDPGTAYHSSSTLPNKVTLCCCCDDHNIGYIARQNQQPPASLQAHEGQRARSQRQLQTSLGTATFNWCTSCKIWRPPKCAHV